MYSVDAPPSFRVVECCFYCGAGRYRNGSEQVCTDTGETKPIGGWCDNFRWAEDNDRRLYRRVMPPEALAAIKEAVRRREEEKQQREQEEREARAREKAEKTAAKCPIGKTGEPDNPCRKCEKREHCTVGAKVEAE